LIRKALALVYCAAIMFLSHQSNPISLPGSFYSVDKFYHFIEFGLCAALVFFAWAYNKKYILILIISFALSDEIHQFFIAGRTCSFFDFIADIIGILLVYFLFRLKDKEKPLLV